MPESLFEHDGVGPAEVRAKRLFAMGAGAASALTIILSLAFAALRGVQPAVEGHQPAILPGLLLIVLVGAGAPWLSLPALRLLAGSGAGASLIGTILALGAPIESDIGVWTHTVTVAIVLSWQLAGGIVVAWTLLGAGVLAAAIQRVATGVHTFPQLVNESQVLLTGVIVTAIAGLALDEARRVDAAARDDVRAAQAAAAQRGRLAARTRAAAVIHDDVLSTLRLAGSELPVPADRLAAQAHQAGASLRALAEEDRRGHTRLSDEIVAMAAQVAPGAAVTLLSSGAAEVPCDVRDAVVGAATQALDNSVRHAGDAVSRAVVVEERGDSVSVAVSDDGRGFDVDAIEAGRLGVRTSIRRRLHDVGGTAAVVSRPGAGTSILLEWTAPPAQAASVENRELPRVQAVQVAVVATVCSLATLVPAFAATASASPWWAPVLVAALILVASEVMGWRRDVVPSYGRSLVSIVLLTAGTVVGVSTAPFTMADTWYATSGAFLLVALATRGRPVAALAGVAVVSVGLLASGVSIGAPVDVVSAIVLQPLLLVVLAAVLTLTVVRLRTDVHTLYERAIASMATAARDAAGRAELRERVAHIEAIAGSLLTRIAAGGSLTSDDRSRCVAMEGRLRDELRAGRLAVPALIDAVARARARGVDVVLLDDRDDDPLSPGVLDALAERMAAGIDGASARAVGRLLPSGRAEAASLTVDGEAVVLGYRDQPTQDDPPVSVAPAPPYQPGVSLAFLLDAHGRGRGSDAGAGEGA